MSCFAGGNESFLSDIYWTLKHILSKDRSICPRCGYTAFQHGFIPDERHYCTECHLWEPKWIRDKNE